jgi:hypothetical protein
MPSHNKKLTVGDELREMAQRADENPDEFAQVLVVFSPLEARFKWWHCGDMLLSHAIGMLEMVKYDLFSAAN